MSATQSRRTAALGRLLLAVLPVMPLTVNAEDPPLFSQVAITPAGPGTPPSITGLVTEGPPNGTVWLQASVDLGTADPWTNIATGGLDTLGSATFTNVPDTSPQATATPRDFFRVYTSVAPMALPGTMVLIPAGSLEMGDKVGAVEGGDSGGPGSTELPIHSVNLGGFYLQNTEVTKAQWDEVATWAATNGYDITVAGGSGKAADHPVQDVTWYEVVKYCNARSEMETLTPCYTVGGATYKAGISTPVCSWSANGYRLPTEAEWEKAARGGSSGQRFSWGDTITHSNANYGADGSSFSYDASSYPGFTYHPNYDDGVAPRTSPVASFPANDYGLYDMSGNVFEWCWDWYSGTYYSISPATDPRGPAAGPLRVMRGGSWSLKANACRTAGRSASDPTEGRNYLGFRPARSVAP